MSDLKFIVTELNKSPFQKNYNLISFHSLSPEDLLQILTDVLGEIDLSQKVDIRTEEPEQTTVRLLTVLRVLKYKPSADVNASVFRQGLVQGEKHVIHPILEWLLSNTTELKKRAYLAQFLVKLEIPPEIRGDAGIAVLYEQYERLVEEFKTVHKESEALKKSGYSTAELRADLDAMEREREIVIKRIERMTRKIEDVENKDGMLEAAHKLRMEKERKKELSNQLADERTTMQQSVQRVARLTQQLQDLRQTSLGATPQGLLQRTEEEIKMTTYIVGQKLPRELETLRNEVEILTNVATQPALTSANIDLLHARIESVNAEMNELVEHHLATTNPVEDKLAPFRQQAAIIARKKDSIAEQFSQLKIKLQSLNDEIQEKQAFVVGGGGVLRGEEFKQYVSKLRVRSSIYKQRRSELAVLKAEGGILARTLDILNNKANSLGDSAEMDASNILPKEDAKSRSLDELGALVTQLNSNIRNRRAQLAPLINELRPLREEAHEVAAIHKEKKSMYDRTAATLDSSTAKLQQEVDSLRAAEQKSVSERELLSAQSVIAQTQLQRAKDELRRYVDKTSVSLREKLGQKITEAERTSRQLKEEQRVVKETVEKSFRQKDLWSSLVTLLECKQQCAEEAKKNAGILRVDKDAETLVLQ